MLHASFTLDNKPQHMLFTSFPTLITPRLTLRQLTATDGQDIFALRSNPEVNQYLDRQPCENINDAITFINKINQSIEQRSALYWAITITGTGALVGTICLFDFSAEKSSCEIGYELLPQFQGRGIMAEAAGVVIDYVFNTLHINNILAYTHQDNQPSIALLMHLKFVPSAATSKENWVLTAATR